MANVFSPKQIIDSGLCIGCGICIAQFPFEKKIRMEFDSYGQLKPQGPAEWLDQTSEIFSRICPFSPLANNEDEISRDIFPNVMQRNGSIGYFINNWVGYVSEDDYRIQGSSGGMTSWLASELIQKGLVDGVAHVVATDPVISHGRHFQYRISRSEKEIKEGAKSRYYPIELSDVLKTIRKKPGCYAVIAIPCIIKAIQLLRQQNPIYQERICYTMALFCGHMKSSRFIESFAWQMNVPVKDVKRVEFRYKIPDRPANWYCAKVTMNDGSEIKKDWWHLVDGDWGAGFLMNSACNFCDDVVGETADVSFGDAWIEPWISDGKGTNIIVTRSEIIQDLITAGMKEGRLKLEEITDEIVEETQAAGLRQRREGLAYRLLWATHGVQPGKRVHPGVKRITKERKRIYWMRYMISKWSHRLFWLARKMHNPEIYLSWARMAASVYYGIVYQQSKWTQIKKRFNSFRK